MGFFRRVIENTVLTNMLALIVLIMGALAFIRMPREAYPNISFNWVYIFALYPGATPEEIERKVIREIEEAIEGIEGISTITSLATENAGQVSLRFETMSRDDYKRRLQDVQREIDSIRDQLPEGVEAIDYFDLDTSTFEPLVHITLAGDYPEAQLKRWVDDLREEVLDVDGISDASLIGTRDRQVFVDVDAAALRATGLPLTAVVDALRAHNLDLPAGNYPVGDVEFMVKTKGEVDSAAELEEIILRPSATGGHLRIRDVADVRAGFEAAITHSRVDGTPAFALFVTRRASANTLDLLDRVRKVSERVEERLPADVEVRLSGDSTLGIRDILRTLYRNAGFGLILVIITLLLFLESRNALFAAVGIAVSFMGTFLFLDLVGETLNGNSLFGLVLVLGMIVDDAIVIIENVFRHVQHGSPPRRAVIKGMSEVAMPVVSSSATTIAGFLPLMLLPGIIGEFLKVVPLVVSVALAVSLFEALIVLPAHVADWGRSVATDDRPPLGSRLLDRIRPAYTRALALSFDHRIIVGAFATILPVLSILVIGMKLADADLFAGEERGQFFVQVWAPEGTTLEAMDRKMRRFEEIVLESVPPEERNAVLTTAGLVRTETDWIWKPAVGEVFVDLIPRKERARTTRQITDSIRAEIASVSGLQAVKIWEVTDGPPAGAPIEFKIKGPYLEDLEVLATRFQEELGALPGVVDVDHNLKPGKQVLEIRLRPDVAGMVALDNAGLATFVRTALDGETATSYLDGDEKIDVVVRLDEKFRRDVTDILSLRVPARMGGEVALSDIADVRVAEGLSTVPRFDGERAVTITGNLAEGGMSGGDVSRWVERRFEELSASFPGYRIDFGGEMKEFEKALSGIGRLGLLGLLLIYMILGAQFRSFIQPLIILYTIPIGLAGAALSLTVSGDALTITTLYGFVALAGVVVNDSLVLIEFINMAREKGMALREAVLDAGRTRLRPICLTTVTTVFGLTPMMLGIGGHSPVWGPLARTIVWGLTVATVLTLIVIPCLYSLVDDVARKLHLGRFHGGRRVEV
ncbi:MAG: hypothetical protein CME06_04620 [Gemmatimonadetes bacterium]|nr:hypothetical protein [Gemmatimonadota bacterium]